MNQHSVQKCGSTSFNTHKCLKSCCISMLYNNSKQYFEAPACCRLMSLRWVQGAVDLGATHIVEPPCRYNAQASHCSGEGCPGGAMDLGDISMDISWLRSWRCDSWVQGGGDLRTTGVHLVQQLWSTGGTRNRPKLFTSAAMLASTQSSLWLGLWVEH